MIATNTTTMKTVPAQAGPMTFVGLWEEDKVFGPEGAELLVMNSAYAPILMTERWIMHNNMWTFVPTGQGIL